MTIPPGVAKPIGAFVARYGMVVIGLVLIAVLLFGYSGCNAVQNWRRELAERRAETATTRADAAERSLAGAHADADITTAARRGADIRRTESRTATQAAVGVIDDIEADPPDHTDPVVHTQPVDPRIMRELEAGDARLRASKHRLRGAR